MSSSSWRACCNWNSINSFLSFLKSSSNHSRLSLILLFRLSHHFERFSRFIWTRLWSLLERYIIIDVLILLSSVCSIPLLSNWFASQSKMIVTKISFMFFYSEMPSAPIILSLMLAICIIESYWQMLVSLFETKSVIFGLPSKNGHIKFLYSEHYRI